MIYMVWPAAGSGCDCFLTALCSRYAELVWVAAVAGLVGCEAAAKFVVRTVRAELSFNEVENHPVRFLAHCTPRCCHSSLRLRFGRNRGPELCFGI